MVDDERVNLHVPEQIEVSYELAGVGSRFLAALIDTSIVAAITVALGGGAWFVRAWLTGASLVSFVTGLIVAGAAILLYIGYHMWGELARNGQPPGKAWTGLRVVSVDGGPVSVEQSAVRNILRLVDFLPISYAIGLVSLLVTRRNQRLGDLAAATMVVKERLETLSPEVTPTVDRPPVPPLPPEVSEELLRSVRAGVRAVSREEERTIRRFLERRYELAPDARRRLATRLADTLRQRFPGIAPGQLANPETLLEIVIRALDERR